MSQFIKGVLVGLISFVAGSAVLSLLLPERPQLPGQETAEQVAPAEETGDTPTAEGDEEQAAMTASDARDDAPGVSAPEASPDTSTAEVDANADPASQSLIPTAAPTVAPTAAPTDAPAPTSDTVAEEATEPTEPTVAPTSMPTVAPTSVPTAPPTATPTATPTVAPTATAIPEPTATPVPTATAAPAPEPTAEPTPEPTAEPTPEPTPTTAPLPTTVPQTTPPAQIVPVTPETTDPDAPDLISPAPNTPAPNTPAPNTPAPNTPAVDSVLQPTPTPPTALPTPAATPAAEANPRIPEALMPRISGLPDPRDRVGVRRGTDTTEDEDTATAGSRLPAPAEGTTIGRLPSIGGAPEPQAPAAPDMQDGFDMALPAYLRYATPVDLPEGARALGVALLDGPGGLRALSGLAVPVTIVLDPFAPDAPARAAAYRDAGHEVALIASDIPPLSTAGDIAQIWQVWSNQFPEIVAVMDARESGIAQSRDTAGAMASFLSQDGHGAIGQRTGVDAYVAAAREQDVPAARVFRRLDDIGQARPTIRRLLERAAFEAQRQQGILVLGSVTNADTLAILNDYAESPSRPGVVLAPASAVLGAP